MKAPDQPHFVQRFKFDFEIEKQEDAYRIQTDLSRIFAQRLQRLLEEIMDELDVPGHVIKIPELVIDLGEIYEGSLEKEVVMRFERAFRQALALRVGELRHPNAAISADRGQKVALVPARIEIVAYYLVNGRLPNGAEQMAGKVEQLFLELIENNPAAILRTLKNVVRDPVGLKRLSTVFSERLVQKLYNLIVTDNAISIGSIEKKLIADTAKATKKPLALVTMEVRRAIFRYLLVGTPSIFDRRKFQVAVTEEVTKVFGLDPVAGMADIAEQQAEFSSLNEKRAKKQAALEVLQRYLKGALPNESPIAVAEAWEFMVTQDAPALKKFLATKSIGIAAIRELVHLLSPAAMRDFIQKTVPSSPMQLIHVAASVTSAFATYGKGSTMEKRISEEVYAVLVHQLAVNPSVTPSSQSIAAAIRAHLAKMQDAPKELLKQWDELGLPGVPSPEALKRKKAEREAKAESEQKAFDAKVAALKSRPKSGKDPLDESGEGPEAETPESAAEEGRKKTKQGKDKTKRGKEREGAEDEADEELEEVDLDDEAFFKTAREQLTHRPDGIEIEELGSDDDELLSTPTIDTAEGRVELVLQMLTTGKRPWWAESVSTMQLELFLKSALSKNPEAVKATFAAWTRTLPSTQYQTVITRLIETLNESTLTSLLHVLAPEISGFMVTVSMALGALLDNATVSLSIPSYLAERHQFIWHYQVQYLLEYMSSGLSAGQLIRYVMKQVAAAVGIGPRPMIEQMAGIAEAEIAKGERRFTAFKAMVPKIFEGLQVNPPTVPAMPADIWTKFQQLEEAEAEGRVGSQVSGLVEMESLTGAERAFLERLQAVKEQSAAQEKERERMATEELERRAKQQQITPKPGEEEDKSKVELALEGAETEVGEKGVVLPEEADRLDQLEKPIRIEGEPQDQKGSEPEIRPKVDLPEAETPEVEEPKEKLASTLPPPLVLSPEEEEAEAKVLMEMIQQYLEHGTLSAAATRFFTASTFKAMLLGTLATRTRPLITMLKAAMSKSSARLRVIAMGDEVAMQVTNLLQVLISDKLNPFVRELLQLFTGGSAPISRVHVLDHAMRYAMRTSGTAFVPLTYVRDLVTYVATLPNRDVREVLTWANKKLESSRSPLKEALGEMLDVVERIEESQASGKRKKAAPATSSEPMYIKAPDGDIYITNAGAGLVHLVFKQLFQAFKLLKEDNLVFVSLEAQTRAAHYIQYLTDKEVDAPEEKMVFNKLLVGLPINQSLEPLSEPINQDEIDTIEYVLENLCQRWTVMKASGPDYVRKTFLMRDGRLRSNGDGWIVRVEQQGLDILKNKIPWATNPIRLPWLTYLIDVDWP